MSQPQITLRQLRYLVALDETRHFRRAAERLGISQPSLSAQIQALEGTLGVQLVERSRARVALSPIGREVAAHAARVLEEVRGLADIASAARNGTGGTIRLGTKPTLGPYLLPHIVTALSRDQPDLRLYVRESVPRELGFELARGDHDVILAQLPVAGAELVTRRLFREPLYLCLPAGHPLAAREAVAADEMAGLQVLSLSARYHLHDRIAGLCEDVGAVLMSDYVGTSLDALRTMVGMGMGATFLPALYARSEIGPQSEVVVRPLRGRSVSRSIGLVWRKSAGRATAYRRIAEVIRTVAAERFPELTLES